jgi:hypothetical protein
VREDSLRPLTGPGPSYRQRGRPGWLAPVAAAVGVALVMGLAVLAGRIPARHAGPAAGLPPGIPRYYVQTPRGPGRPVVRSTATGRMISVVPVPVTGNPPGDAISAADGTGTFFVAAFPPGHQGERLYEFRLTPAGRVTGFSAVPVAELASRNWAADALAVSPDGSRIAVSMRYAARQSSCGHHSQQVCPQQRPDYVLAINLATGARTVWRWAGSPVVHSFSVESLSWTSDGREVVLLGQWCEFGLTNQTCAQGSRGAEVEELDPAAGNGGVGGRGILYQMRPLTEIVQAQINRDGTAVTAVVLHGHTAGYGHVPRICPWNASRSSRAASAGCWRCSTSAASAAPWTRAPPRISSPSARTPPASICCSAAGSAGTAAPAGSTAGSMTGGWCRCSRPTAGRQTRRGDPRAPGKSGRPGRPVGRHGRYAEIYRWTGGASAVISP